MADHDQEQIEIERLRIENETLRQLVLAVYEFVDKRANNLSKSHLEWLSNVDKFFSDGLIHLQNKDNTSYVPVDGVHLWCGKKNGNSTPKVVYEQLHTKVTCVACLTAFQNEMYERAKRATDLAFEAKTRQSEVEHQHERQPEPSKAP